MEIFKETNTAASKEFEKLLDNQISKILSKTEIYCLPSYREGMPKCLLEAAAASCAVVTTDVTGCRDSIIPKVTGELVKVMNANEFPVLESFPTLQQTLFFSFFTGCILWKRFI